MRGRFRTAVTSAYLDQSLPGQASGRGRARLEKLRNLYPPRLAALAHPISPALRKRPTLPS